MFGNQIETHPDAHRIGTVTSWSALRGPKKRGRQRDQRWNALDHQYLPADGSSPVAGSENDAAKKEEREVAAGEVRRIQQRPDQTCRQKAVVEALVRRKDRRRFRLFSRHPKCLSAERLLPHEHLKHENVEMLNRDESHHDVCEDLHRSR